MRSVYFNSIVHRRRAIPELTQITTAIDPIDVMTIAGIALISATVGFHSATVFKINKNINTEPMESSEIARIAKNDESTVVAVIPSPDQIWTSVQDKIMTVSESQSMKTGQISIKQKPGSNQKLWSQFRLGLQSLTIPARHQILILALTELQRNILTLQDPQPDTKLTNLDSFAFQVILLSYTSASEKWIGSKPAYYQLDVDEEDRERNHEGFWKIIEEKLPIYTAVLKYLRYPAPTEQDPDSNQSETILLNRTPTGDPSAGLCLKFGSREGHLLTSSVQILEDMVLVVAELVALDYLLALTKGPIKSQYLTDWPMSLKVNLRNTRTLERYRNQVFFGWWIFKNFQSVVAVFEDYHFLWGINQKGNFTQRRCFVRRSEELEKLKGWGLGFSYFLEALDALEPIFKTVLKKLGDMVSFFLVQLIGRSVGLIIKGIQTSITIPWNNKQNPTNL